jgi:hypothetical protein
MFNKENLSDIWKDLLSDNSEGEFHVERTINIYPLEIKLRILKPLDKYSIIISDDSGYHSNDILTKNKYFKVSQKEEDGKRALVVELNDNFFSNEFILFSKIILEISQKSVSASDAISTIAKKLKDFEKFISSPTKRFNFEKRMGLMGELYFLEDFLLKNFSEDECIDSWKGPLNSSQDFIFNNFRFEIKSSSNDNNSVKISSLNQLDPQEKNLFLVRNHISENNSLGITITEMVNSIDKKLKNISSDLSMQFQSLVRSYGYAVEEEKEFSNFKYILSGRDFYIIKDDFPSIHKNNAPAGVIHVSYDLDLTKCSNWATNEIEILNKTINYGYR